MKQKIVISLTLNDAKSRQKALEIAVRCSGVENVSFPEGKNQLEVTGDGVDAVGLTFILKKKMGFAEIATLNPIKNEGKEDKKLDEKKKPVAEPKQLGQQCQVPHVTYYYEVPVCPYCGYQIPHVPHSYGVPVCPYCVYYVDPCRNPCSIM